MSRLRESTYHRSRVRESTYHRSRVRKRVLIIGVE